MKSTGMIRAVDELGRVVIPIEIRKVLQIESKDPLMIFTNEDGSIALIKYEPCCIFCGNGKDNVSYKGKNICRSCIAEI